MFHTHTHPIGVGQTVEGERNRDLSPASDSKCTGSNNKRKDKWSLSPTDGVLHTGSL